jgi:hypothetical protein
MLAIDFAKLKNKHQYHLELLVPHLLQLLFLVYQIRVHHQPVNGRILLHRNNLFQFTLLTAHSKTPSVIKEFLLLLLQLI